MQPRWKLACPLAAALVLASGFGAATAADYSATAPKPAQDTGKSMAPATGARTAAPSKAETSDAAFRKLDSAGKGYVTKDDAKSLAGFDKAFQDNDANHDGRLTAAEFAKAWQEFTGNKS